MRKKDVFSVITNKRNGLSKKQQEHLSEVSRANSGRSPKEILQLILALGEFVKKKGGTIESFCYKAGVSPRQMREYRAKFRANPKFFLQK